MQKNIWLSEYLWRNCEKNSLKLLKDFLILQFDIEFFEEIREISLAYNSPLAPIFQMKLLFYKI